MATRKKAARKTARKKAARKTASKKSARKKATVKRASTAPVGNKPLTKSEVYTQLADATELKRTDVRRVFDALTDLVGQSLGTRGPGHFTVPGLCKMVEKTRPARAARKGINPFTGEEMMFKAKPKSKTVRIRPTKAVRDLV